MGGGGADNEDGGTRKRETSDYGSVGDFRGLCYASEPWVHLTERSDITRRKRKLNSGAEAV